jgi:hypothetical protein
MEIKNENSQRKHACIIEMKMENFSYMESNVQRRFVLFPSEQTTEW